MDVGVYLYKNIVSVLSIQHQTIHLFHLQSDGTLVKVKKWVTGHYFILLQIWALFAENRSEWWLVFLINTQIRKPKTTAKK